MENTNHAERETLSGTMIHVPLYLHSKLVILLIGVFTCQLDQVEKRKEKTLREHINFRHYMNPLNKEQTLL